MYAFALFNKLNVKPYKYKDFKELKRDIFLSYAVHKKNRKQDGF